MCYELLSNENEWNHVHITCSGWWEKSYENSGYKSRLVGATLMKLSITRRPLLTNLSESAQFDQWEGGKKHLVLQRKVKK